MKKINWKNIFLCTAAVSLMMGMLLTVNGEEKEETNPGSAQKVITEIRHKHMGNEKEAGGCYSVSIPHVHQGNEMQGGACYQTPVYHTHDGNAGEGGGCFTQPVYHQHEGDEQQGGACYEEITHSHTGDCYSSKSCMVQHVLTGEVLETWTDYCFTHQNTTFGKRLGTATHGSCGAGEEEKYYSYCLACGFVAPTIHSYEELLCQVEEGTVTGYRQNCGKDETTVEGYLTSCGLEETQVVAYALSCDRTVEKYGIGCGWEQGQLLGRLIVTNETPQQTQKAELSAVFQDLSGGSLKTGNPVFSWEEKAGNPLGTGEKITVEKNGTYLVRLHLENKDVEEEGLVAEIVVENIGSGQPESTPATEEEPQPESTPEPEEKEQPDVTPAAQDAGESDGSDLSDSSEEEEASEDEEALPEPSPVPLAQTPVASVSRAANPPLASASPISVASPIKKEVQKVEMKENKAGEEIAYQVKQEKRREGFFADPALQVVAVTGGSLFFCMGLLGLLFYFRHSVKISNDNGQGRMIRLGRCMVKTEGEYDTITITPAMAEKAYTNRYGIHPGILLAGKKEERQLLVRQDTKSVAVFWSRNMIVML